MYPWDIRLDSRQTFDRMSEQKRNCQDPTQFGICDHGNRPSEFSSFDEDPGSCRSIFSINLLRLSMELRQPCLRLFGKGEFFWHCRQMYSRIAIRPTNAQALRSERTAFLSSDTRRTLPLLLFSPCRRDRFNKIEFGFGVRELLDLFDLQAPIFVGNDVCDEDRFVVHLDPDRGLRLVGHLRGRYHVT
jgi:hypothetical protein